MTDPERPSGAFYGRRKGKRLRAQQSGLVGDLLPALRVDPAALADPLVGEEAQAKLRHVTSLTRGSHQLEGRITRLIENGALFSTTGIPAFDPASDRIMICGSAPMLHDTKAIALAAGFTEGSNHEPGSFVVERAFAA